MVVVGEKSYKHIDEGPIRKRQKNNEEGESDEDDSGMRVGPNYQATIPDYVPDLKPNCKHSAMLVWSPNYDHVIDPKIEEFNNIARDTYGYTLEQSLGMLFWHQHNIDRALKDLQNFLPYPEEWTLEDKVLFEQAFSFHGKTFHKIKSMLPDKSVGSLVRHYYSWKKSRSKMSLIDNYVYRLNNKRNFSEVEESESEVEDANKEQKENGTNKSNTGKAGFGSRKLLHEPHLRNKRKAPRGIHLCAESIKQMISGYPDHINNTIDEVELQLEKIKRQVQKNKQCIGALEEESRYNLPEQYHITDNPPKLIGKWSNEELLLAVQGLRKYGKDFKAIAEVIGNKSETLVRSFFVNYRRRYNLDEVLAEYELERSKQLDQKAVGKKEAVIEGDIDQKVPLSKESVIIIQPTDPSALPSTHDKS